MSNSTFSHYEPCPSCGSQDNLARYSDGHAFCFGCGAYEPGNAMTSGSATSNLVTSDSATSGFILGEAQALPTRGLTLETCQRWRYEASTYKGRPCQIANFFDSSGKKVGQKLRFADKSFVSLGFNSHGTLPSGTSPLYGMHLCSKGKQIVVTEGEVDALSVSQIFDHKWPVVSLPNGAASAVKALKEHLAWFDGFERVVLLFDQDEAGQKAAKLCAGLFKPGHCLIAKLPLKDPNDMLMAGRSGELVQAIWHAKVYRSDGVISGKDLGINDTWASLFNEQNKTAIAYPYKGLTEKTGGIRKGEIVTLCAGTGIGKSHLCRELALHLLDEGQRVGYIALEEHYGKTICCLINLSLSRPTHTPLTPDEQAKAAWDKIVPKMAFYDHFGSLDINVLLGCIRYMVVTLECPYIILDHLSIVISGLNGGDERRLIDNVMTSLRSLVEELQISLILVSHLKRIDSKANGTASGAATNGRSHEEGGITSLSHLRGSGGVAQLSDMVIGLERNQQTYETDTTALGMPIEGAASRATTVRVLKNRFKGETGIACTFTYDPNTGRLTESLPVPPVF